jgi:membrane protein implicated in regulation of membrane protease activity
MFFVFRKEYNTLEHLHFVGAALAAKSAAEAAPTINPYVQVILFSFFSLVLLLFLVP